MKIAFLFTGQGAQTVGMGQELYHNFESVRKVYDLASQTIGRSVADISFKSTQEELNQTVNSQPAIFTLSMAGNALLQEAGILPHAVAGFSLGECTALCGANVLDLPSTLHLIALRGAAMQKASDATKGAMVAILGLDREKITAICGKIEGYVVPVNFNCSSQTVIAGEEKAVLEAAEQLQTAGATKTVRLNVSGAFHSRLMQSAAEEFVPAIQNFPFQTPTIAFYSNVYGEKLTDFSAMPAYLGQQMTHPVAWQQIIETMLADGIEQFVELGAGRVLSGLIRRISRTAKICNIEDEVSFEKAMDALKKE